MTRVRTPILALALIVMLGIVGTAFLNGSYNKAKSPEEVLAEATTPGSTPAPSAAR